MKQRALFALGVLLIVVAWSLPHHSFAAHMTMHMTVVAIAAPFLALGLAGTRFDPVLLAPRFFAPIPASLVELVVVWAWHTPMLHHAAHHHTAVFVLEQATFLISGLFVWLSALGGTATRARLGAGVIALLLTSMHMTLLGALLALPPRPIFFGSLDDQHLGGAIMLLIGGASYLIGGIYAASRMLRRSVA